MNPTRIISRCVAVAGTFIIIALMKAGYDWRMSDMMSYYSEEQAFPYAFFSAVVIGIVLLWGLYWAISLWENSDDEADAVKPPKDHGPHFYGPSASRKH